MSDMHTGWSWFDRDPRSGSDDKADTGLPDLDRDLHQAYARCFSGPDGTKVLAHLRALTLDRALGPDASAETLRHVEGQRQLVAYIQGQFKRGQSGS